MKQNLPLMRSPLVSRRSVLKGAIALSALSALAPLTRAASAPALTKLENSLVVLGDVGANVLALSGKDGLVLVDSGTAESTDALLKHVKELQQGSKLTLFNSHWHAEQTGGNEALGKLGATIIAHEKTRVHLSTEYYIPHESRYHKALPKVAQPTKTCFYKPEMLSANGQTIEYGYLMQAHTDGDIYVYFHEANVIAVGDVISPVNDPSTDWYGGGWLGGRVDAMNQLLKMSNDQTRFVPAFGPVQSKAQVQAERDLMSKLYDKTVDMVRQGMTAKDMLDAGAMNGLTRTFADPYKFLYDNGKALWAHHNKLGPNVV